MWLGWCDDVVLQCTALRSSKHIPFLLLVIYLSDDVQHNERNIESSLSLSRSLSISSQQCTRNMRHIDADALIMRDNFGRREQHASDYMCDVRCACPIVRTTYMNIPYYITVNSNMNSYSLFARMRTYVVALCCQKK